MIMILIAMMAEFTLGIWQYRGLGLPHMHHLVCFLGCVVLSNTNNMDFVTFIQEPNLMLHHILPRLDPRTVHNFARSSKIMKATIYTLCLQGIPQGGHGWNQKQLGLWISRQEHANALPDLKTPLTTLALRVGPMLHGDMHGAA